MKYDLNLTLTYRCNPKTVGITLICEVNCFRRPTDTEMPEPWVGITIQMTIITCNKLS